MVAASKMESDMDTSEVINTWVNIMKIPRIAGGHVLEGSSHLKVSVDWVLDDYCKKERTKFKKFYSIPKSMLGENCESIADALEQSTFGPIPINSKISCISDSGALRAEVVDKDGSKEKTKDKCEVLQIWNETTLLKSYDFSELDKHGNIYSSGGEWGTTIAWSQDEKKLAYIAEKKKTKTKPFYTSSVKPSIESTEGSSASKDPNEGRGEEYAFKQGWGEQMNDAYESVIVVLDIDCDTFEIFSINDDFPFDIQWVNSTSLIGTALIKTVWRLGYIYCTNRESRIFHVSLDGSKYKYLSDAGRAAFSPRVRPDGQIVVWTERAVDGPHLRANAVISAKILDLEAPTEKPQVMYSADPSTLVPIYGNLPSRCWSPDGSKFFAITPNDSVMKVVVLSLNQDPVIPKSLCGVDNVLSISGNYLLISTSKTVQPPCLELVDISKNFHRIKLTNPQKALDFEVETKFIEGQVSPPSIYSAPRLTVDTNKNSVPLIVWPHGGPHAVFVDSYIPEAAFLMKLGFALLRINYIGSIGGKKDVTDKLLGHIGTMDVKDCQSYVESVLKSESIINPEKMVLFGGSHGGFLSAHLSSSYPESYKAVVVRNPVIDLNTMVGTSDITDWVYAECGVKSDPSFKTILPAGQSDEDLETYRSMSPITYAHKVTAPTLLLLGSEDLRVPSSQGLAYYRALLAHNKVAEVRMYPDCHPLGTVPVRMDNIIHSSLWFLKHLRK